MPGLVLDQVAAQHRAAGRRHHHGYGKHRPRLRPLRRRECPEHHGHAHGREHAAAHALDHPKGDQAVDIPGRTQSAEPSVNTARANMKVRFVPKRSPTQPLTGMKTARLSR